MKTDEELLVYFEEKYNEIPPDVLEKAIKILQDHLLEKDRQVIRDLYKKHGPHMWMREVNDGFGHFSFGMAIRNCLRQEGLTDELLPDKNWDDYYISVIEKSLGLR